METITMQELKQRLGDLTREEIVLDVRSPQEYRDGHVPGSRNIPVDQVLSHLDELRAYARVYVHCKMGGRAAAASKALADAGLENLVCVAGSGMADWIARGFPVEK